MNRKFLMIMMAVVSSVVVGVGVALAGEGRTVKTLGDEVLKPNVKVEASLRFSPGPITVQVGDTITFVGADKAGAPHTVTLTRNPDLLVDDAADLFLGGCPDCEAAAIAALDAHLGAGPPVFEVGTGDGFGDDGDSLLFGGPFPDISQTLTNVSPGDTVHYFCAIHPWMQGTLDVRG